MFMRRTASPAREMPVSLRRWVVFNSVGALGFLVQLAMLALLMGGFHWHYVPATALAVEAAVVHNFLWHERWTWADRTDSSWSGICRRFMRFSLTNGVVSIVGNLVFMRLFLDTFLINYLAANTMAIVACSILNFIASDRLVFRSASTGATVLQIVPKSPRTRPMRKEEP
jgi:putative flippase GtrA